MSDYDKLEAEIFERSRLALELSDRGEVEIHLTPQQWLILHAEYFTATRSSLAIKSRITMMTPYGDVILVRSVQ